MGQLTQRIEGAGTPQPKTTHFSYNKTGLLDSKQNPDGKKLHYRYDSLGRLKEQYSSDGLLHYTYEYDAQDNLTLVKDLIHHTANSKTYDAFNNLACETLNNGLTVEYTYDELGRLVALKLPDSSHIQYSHKGPNLAKITRISLAHIYTHTYEKYDFNGSPTQAHLIGNAGKLHCSYDLLGRVTQRSAPHMTESLTAHDPAGNLLSRTLKDSLGSYQGEYAYNDLDQLESESGTLFHYDSLHNLRTKNQQKAKVNALNQLTALGERQFAYDPNGCRLSQTSPLGKTEYSYDVKGRLTSVITDDQKAVYLYDASDRRISKTLYQKEQGVWKFTDTQLYFYQGNKEIGACLITLSVTLTLMEGLFLSYRCLPYII